MLLLWRTAGTNRENETVIHGFPGETASLGRTHFLLRA